MTELYRFWGKAKPEDGYRPLNVATPRTESEGNVATIRMYGPIDSWGGEWGVSAEEVSAALDALPDSVSEIQLRINSPGGEGFEGLTILNMLRAHPAKVVAVVDGLAASAASFIAAGCDETVMSPGTQMMIHDAWGLAMGNPSVMRKAATFLDSVSDGIADLYVEAAGGYRAKWRSLMGEETWYTAKEAVAAGLADRVDVIADMGVTSTAGIDPEPDPNMDPTQGEPVNSYDLSQFRYAGRDEAPDPLELAAKAEQGAPDVAQPDAPSADTPAEEDAAPTDAEAAADSAEVPAEDDRVDNEKAAAQVRTYRDVLSSVFTA